MLTTAVVEHERMTDGNDKGSDDVVLAVVREPRRRSGEHDVEHATANPAMKTTSVDTHGRRHNQRWWSSQLAVRKSELRQGEEGRREGISGDGLSEMWEPHASFYRGGEGWGREIVGMAITCWHDDE